VRPALAGGASIVDAKEPALGALGAVDRRTLVEMTEALAGAAPFSVALGDAAPGHAGERATALAAGFAARAGAAYVKVGFAGCADRARVAAVVAVARRAVLDAHAPHVRVVAVAYADAERAGSIAPAAIVEAAARGGAAGVLLDSAFKDGGGLFDLIPAPDVAAWVRRAHAAGLVAALAGKLDLAGVAAARTLGADIAGVRGAACVGGRSGAVSELRVRELVVAAGGHPPRADASGTAVADEPPYLSVR